MQWEKKSFSAILVCFFFVSGEYIIYKTTYQINTNLGGIQHTTDSTHITVKSKILNLCLQGPISSTLQNKLENKLNS